MVIVALIFYDIGCEKNNMKIVLFYYVCTKKITVIFKYISVIFKVIYICDINQHNYNSVNPR